MLSFVFHREIKAAIIVNRQSVLQFNNKLSYTFRIMYIYMHSTFLVIAGTSFYSRFYAS
jgi:hypothetical protein